MQGGLLSQFEATFPAFAGKGCLSSLFTDASGAKFIMQRRMEEGLWKNWRRY
jgi:hypothetical protein